MADRIEYRLGPGIETIAQLEGPFDLVFIDAEKSGYIDYYEAVLPKLADGGLIIADNALRDGQVLAEDTAEVMHAFNERVRNDSRVQCVLLTVRDGMLLIMKR